MFPPPIFDPELGMGALSRGVQKAYRRYLEGLQTIVNSLDVPVGLTPKEVVWRLNKTTLYHYTPTRPPEERHPVPILLVYALINKPFIFDLAPGRSFVEYMIDQGYEMYLLDWGAPGPEDQATTFNDYVTEYLHRAVRRVLRHAGADDLTMLGYCIGANLSVAYAGLYPDAPIRNLVLLTAPLDFGGDNAGSMAVWMDEKNLDLDKLINAYGNIPGELIRTWAKMLKPMENFVGSYVTMWKIMDDERATHGWQAMNRWVEDVIPFAGEAFRQFVTQYLRKNELIKGELRIRNKIVDLANISCPLLNVVAKYDHIVATEQSTSIMDLVSSEDKELKIIPSTHVGLMASHRAKDKLWPELIEWLEPRSV